MILIHGWGGGVGVWKPLFPDSVPERVCPDFSGVTQHAMFLPEVLRILPSHPTLVVGWSMGALLAVEAASAEPGRVSGLILIGGTPRFVDRNRSRGWPEQALRKMQSRLRHDTPAVLMAFRRQMFSATEADGLESFNRANPFPEAVNFSPEGLVAGLEYLIRTHLSDHLERLACPVLWIHGGEDRVCPPGAPRRHRGPERLGGRQRRGAQGSE